MARVKLVKPETVTDPAIKEIFEWVTDMEGHVPNHFFVEMNFPEYFKAKLGSSKVLWEQGELEMNEIQHIGILISKANGCPYCTGAFCTILSHGLGSDEDYVAKLVDEEMSAVEDPRLKSILEFCLKVNEDPRTITDEDVDNLRELGLTDKGVIQVIHLVSDFGSYNRLNLALKTDYDYKNLWRQVGFKEED